MDVDFDGRPLHAGQRLVDHDSGIGQRKAFPSGSRCQQHGAHRRRLSDAVGRHVAGHELHRVVDR